MIANDDSMALIYLVIHMPVKEYADGTGSR